MKCILFNDLYRPQPISEPGFNYKIHVRLGHVRKINLKAETRRPPIKKADYDSAYKYFESAFLGRYESDHLMRQFSDWTLTAGFEYDHYMLLTTSGAGDHGYKTPYAQLCERGSTLSIIYVHGPSLTSNSTFVRYAVHAIMNNIGVDSIDESGTCFRYNISTLVPGDGVVAGFSPCQQVLMRRQLAGLQNGVPKFCTTTSDCAMREHENQVCDAIDFTIEAASDNGNRCDVVCERYGRKVTLLKKTLFPCENHGCCVDGRCTDEMYCSAADCRAQRPPPTEPGCRGDLAEGCGQLVTEHGGRFCSTFPYGAQCCVTCAGRGFVIASNTSNAIYRALYPRSESVRCYKCGQYPDHMRSSCLRYFERQAPVLCPVSCYLYTSYDNVKNKYVHSRGCGGPAESKFNNKCRFPFGIHSVIDPNLILKCCDGHLCNNFTVFYEDGDIMWNNFKAKVYE